MREAHQVREICSVLKAEGETKVEAEAENSFPFHLSLSQFTEMGSRT